MAKHVWYHSFPARILHWVNAAIIGLLATTGLYIRDPIHFNVFANMDLARKTHFIAMYLMISGTIFRLYYSYRSKDYREMIFRFKDIKKLPAFVSYYLFLRKTFPDYEKYNPGQKMLYSVWAIVLLFQVATGFALYYPTRFGHIVREVGGLVVIRQAHFMVTWILIITVSIHVYLSFLSGWTVVKSMIVAVEKEKPLTKKTVSV